MNARQRRSAVTTRVRARRVGPGARRLYPSARRASRGPLRARRPGAARAAGPERGLRWDRGVFERRGTGRSSWSWRSVGRRGRGARPAALSCAGSGIEDRGAAASTSWPGAAAAADRLGFRPSARGAARRPACRRCGLPPAGRFVISVAADEDGLGAAGTAVTVARGGLAVVHVAPEHLQVLLDTPSAPRLRRGAPAG